MFRMKAIAVFGFALMALPAFGFECHSIDTTFRPYWSVEFGPITMTYPAGFSLRFTKTEDLAGSVVKRFNAGGHGSMNESEFDITLANGYLRGHVLGDNVWKAELSWDGAAPEELLCQ